jgi:hypothetical protein
MSSESSQPELKLNPFTDIAKQLAQLLEQDPVQAQALKNELARQGVLQRVLIPPSRPKGTYYNAHYGNLLAPVLDAMVADSSKKFEFVLNQMGKGFERMSLKTLHCLVSQAFLYLRENKDTDEVKRKAYNDLWEQVEVRQYRDAPQRVSIQRLGKHQITELPASEVATKHGEADWRLILGRWLDDPTPDKPKLELNKLSLTESEVDELDIQLNSLAGIVARVRHDSIMVVKG